MLGYSHVCAQNVTNLTCLKHGFLENIRMYVLMLSRLITWQRLTRPQMKLALQMFFQDLVMVKSISIECVTSKKELWCKFLWFPATLLLKCTLSLYHSRTNTNLADWSGEAVLSEHKTFDLISWCSMCNSHSYTLRWILFCLHQNNLFFFLLKHIYWHPGDSMLASDRSPKSLLTWSAPSKIKLTWGVKN